MQMILFTVYQNTGSTVQLAWQGIAGTFLAVFNHWIMEPRPFVVLTIAPRSNVSANEKSCLVEGKAVGRRWEAMSE